MSYVAIKVEKLELGKWPQSHFSMAFSTSHEKNPKNMIFPIILLGTLYFKLSCKEKKHRKKRLWPFSVF